MSCIICEKKTNKTYDNMNLCEDCFQTNLVHFNSFNPQLEYEPPDHIIDNIYLGSQKSGVDVNQLFELNIRYILILGKGMKMNFDQIVYQIIEIDDSLEQNLSDYITQALDFIAESQKNHSNILVHCVSGISRSASIVIAYIMDKYQMNYEQAYSQVKAKRAVIRPNSNFIEQLNKFR